MTCEISEIRRQLESLQQRLDEYENRKPLLVDKYPKGLVDEVKEKCIEALSDVCTHIQMAKNKKQKDIFRYRAEIIKAIQEIK
jgi:uncharacterized coiled-coil protein SlyX